MATDLHHEAGGDDAAHDHHAFDPEPIRELPPDEPQTPLWLPALGLVLLVIFGIYLALGDGEAPGEGVSATAEAPADATAPAAAAPAAPPAQGAGEPAPRPLDQLSPEQRQALEERVRNLREQRQPGAPPGIGPIPGGAPARPAPPARDPHEGHGH
jgi:pyruvate/2-oxoglutarate dehydrogenase complex dihydrolipoamide acyltransferase (E2) component